MSPSPIAPHSENSYAAIVLSSISSAGAKSAMPDMTQACSAAVARLQCWQRYLTAMRQRRLVEWSGVKNPAILAPVWQVFPTPHVWIGAELPTVLPESVRFLNLKQARTQLGREVGTLVIDARTAFDADAFGAIAGALIGGGVVVLLTSVDAKPVNGFEQWRRRVMADDPDVLTVPTGGLKDLPLPPAIPASCTGYGKTPACSSLLPSSVWQAVKQQAVTADQADAIDILYGAPQRALTLLSAARGRGKSAALGLAVAAWLQEGNLNTLWLTAPRAASVDALFERVQALCPQGVRDGNQFQWGASTVRFIAPDALSQYLQESDAVAPALLVVDEAAALPLPFLKCWLEACPHVVLSTTQHGYEGSAQGFAHHIQQMSEQANANGYQCCELDMPIRWAANDPLERLTTRLLCLDAAPCSSLNDGDWHIEALKPQYLVAQPELLHEVFGLLVKAHYRTTPSDLQTLLDHPSLSLWVGFVKASASSASQVAAVVMTFDEGGLEAELAQAVADGRRRPPGHLLPQTLALHTGDAGVARQRWRRITRIAVHPQCRRQGLGSRVLAHVHQCAQREGIDQLGVSFGGKLSTLAFWQRNGFTAVRVGLKDDTVTGERAIMMARACGSTTAVAAISAQFWPTFIIQLAFELASMSPVLIAALLRDQYKELPALDDVEHDAIRRFGDEKAPLASVRQPLQRALLRNAHRLIQEDCAVLAGVLLQGRSEPWVRAQLPQLAGKRAVEQWLRAKVALWARYSAC